MKTKEPWKQSGGVGWVGGSWGRSFSQAEQAGGGNKTYNSSNANRDGSGSAAATVAQVAKNIFVQATKRK